ncbi:MAG: phosphatidylserine/phosphatidylglycerophosphate/cardiolipin synthase family protein [Methylotenera sp.]|nr:phosphatidylserine/phosphatidylglycerophosphate/cardiolipin synthase family protein [Oligoflexia bacterium]
MTPCPSLLRKLSISLLTPAVFLACSHVQQRVPSSDGAVSQASQTAGIEQGSESLASVEDTEAAGAGHRHGLNEGRPWGFSRKMLRGLYVNGVETPTFAFLKTAKSSIDIEIYEMNDRDFRAQLREALDRGVHVRVVKDPNPVGEKCKFFDVVDEAKDDEDCQDLKSLVTEIKESPEGAFVPFNKAELCGIPGKSCFEHGKMIIVDGKAALLSTGNFNGSNLCNQNQNPKICNRDYSYVTHDREVVRTLTSIFEHDLEGKAYDLPSLMAPGIEEKLTVSPYSLAPLVKFILSARESIEIENQYLKEPQINQALIAASKSGIKVSLTVASLCAFGKPKKTQLQRIAALFTPFDEAGISTRLFTSTMTVGGRAGYLHAKAIIVDGKYAWVGSVNGSTTSVSQNREYGIFFRNPAMVQHLRNVIVADHAHPQSESWQESVLCTKDHATRIAPSDPKELGAFDPEESTANTGE